MQALGSYLLSMYAFKIAFIVRVVGCGSWGLVLSSLCWIICVGESFSAQGLLPWWAISSYKKWGEVFWAKPWIWYLLQVYVFLTVHSIFECKHSYLKTKFEASTNYLTYLLTYLNAPCDLFSTYFTSLEWNVCLTSMTLIKRYKTTKGAHEICYQKWHKVFSAMSN